MTYKLIRLWLAAFAFTACTYLKRKHFDVLLSKCLSRRSLESISLDFLFVFEQKSKNNSSVCLVSYEKYFRFCFLSYEYRFLLCIVYTVHAFFVCTNNRFIKFVSSQWAIKWTANISTTFFPSFWSDYSYIQHQKFSMHSKWSQAIVFSSFFSTKMLGDHFIIYD